MRKWCVTTWNITQKKMLTLITLGRGGNRLIRWLLSLSLFPFLFPFVSPHLSENADLSFPLPICYARYSKGEEQLRGALRKRSICSSRSPFSSPFAFSSLEINLRLVLFFFFSSFLSGLDLSMSLLREIINCTIGTRYEFINLRQGWRSLHR